MQKRRVFNLFFKKKNQWPCGSLINIWWYWYIINLPKRKERNILTEECLSQNSPDNETDHQDKSPYNKNEIKPLQQL